MENASKALIMAGAVLIAILIISLSVLVYKNFSGSVKDSANMDEQEVANFNSKISPYLGDNVSGSQVNALIQLVVSINNSAIREIFNSKTKPMIYLSIDFEKGAFEVCNHNGKHVGEFSYEGIQTGKAKEDHSIRIKK